jgi:hypothetical protein
MDLVGCWRCPVKSLQGFPVDGVDVTPAGCAGRPALGAAIAAPCSCVQVDPLPHAEMATVAAPPGAPSSAGPRIPMWPMSDGSSEAAAQYILDTGEEWTMARSVVGVAASGGPPLLPSNGWR